MNWLISARLRPAGLFRKSRPVAAVAAATLVLAAGVALAPTASAVPPTLTLTPTTTLRVNPSSTTTLGGLAVSGDASDTLQVTVSTDTGTLAMPTQTGLTLAYGNSWSGGASITVTGTQSAINTGLASVQLSSPASGTAKISLTAMIAQSGYNFLAPNQHFYEYVSNSGISWTAADAAAKQLSFQGQPGYLATIPNATVNNFISSKIANATNVWFGLRSYESIATDGSQADATVNGTTYPRVWRWADGSDESPIAGGVVSECSNQTPSCTFQNTSSFYSAWASGEPNNSGGNTTTAYAGEWVAVTNWSGTAGSWNDLAPAGSTSISGYVVEFGGKTNSNSALGTGFAGVTTASSNVLISNAATVPTAPVVSEADGDSSATLSWNPPVDGGAAISGYQVSTDGGTNWTTVTPTSTTAVVNGNLVTTLSTTLTGLTNGNGYNAIVRAVNSVGNSAASNSVSLTPRGVPGAPTSVSASAGNAQAAVAFLVPSNMNGATAYNYLVTAAPGGQTATCTSSPCIVTGLTNGTAYTFTVQAMNAAGYGAASAPSNSVTPATIPGAPTINSVTAANASAVLAFTPPASNGGSAIVNYTVTAGGVPVGYCTVSPCTISGLYNGSTYSFTMHANNAVGSGPESGASSSITLPNVPSAPIIGSATRGNAQATVTFGTAAGNGSTITGYTVVSSPGGVSATCASSPCIVTGLTNGTAYTFTVHATNAVGDGASSAPSNSVTPATTPGAPTITAVTSGVSSATVTFTAPASNGGSPITGYTLTASPGGLQAACTTSPCTINGLTNGTAYTFTLHATNVLGNGPESSASASATPATVPGAPTIGSATGGNAQASVSFTAPASNGGATITGYTVTSAPGNIAASCPSSPCVVSGLTNGTAYTFTVKANNSAGAGASSAASNSVTPATTPGAPTISTVTVTNSAATITFAAPASNGGSAIMNYTATASPGGLQVTCSSSPCVVNGLTNGQPYTFTLHATNGVGAGPESVASASVTPATTASAPTIGTATGGNGQATVTFTASTSNGGSAITGYTVTSSPGGVSATCASSPCIVSGLTNGTAYTFTVAANNGPGVSAASAASNSVTPATTPGIPTGVSATAANGAASVSFTAPASNGGSAITDYVVTVSPGGATVTCAGSPCAITGLTNGTAYRFSVHAENVVGAGTESAVSAAVTPATTPDAPTAVSAVRGDASALVSFTAPASNGGAAITGYTVTSAPGGLTASCATSPCPIVGLSNGVAYTFTVHATNSAGNGPESAASSAITPATVPGAPAIIGVSRGNGSAQVSFVGPAADGGDPVTGYVLTIHPGGGTVACTTSPCTVPGLVNGTSYTFTMHAANTVGAGSESNVSAAITPATTPDAPGNLAVQRGNGSADLTFDAPASDGGNAITGYEVSTDGGTSWAPLTTTGTAPIAATITGLTNGTAYDIEVRAVNGVGSGTATGPQGATPATVPGLRPTRPARGATVRSRSAGRLRPTTAATRSPVTSSRRRRAATPAPRRRRSARSPA